MCSFIYKYRVNTQILHINLLPRGLPLLIFHLPIVTNLSTMKSSYALGHSSGEEAGWHVMKINPPQQSYSIIGSPFGQQ
jgi:hypothetical protein